MLVVTHGWALVAVFLQDDRRIAFTGMGKAKKPDHHVLIASLTGLHPSQMEYPHTLNLSNKLLARPGRTFKNGRGHSQSIMRSDGATTVLDATVHAPAEGPNYVTVFIYL
jgi:hypothetical protein